MRVKTAPRAMARALPGRAREARRAFHPPARSKSAALQPRRMALRRESPAQWLEARRYLATPQARARRQLAHHEHRLQRRFARLEHRPTAWRKCAESPARSDAAGVRAETVNHHRAARAKTPSLPAFPRLLLELLRVLVPRRSDLPSARSL